MAVQIKKHFEKAQVRQNAQTVKGNSDSTGLGGYSSKKGSWDP